MGLMAPGPQARSSMWWSETLAEDDGEFERRLSPASRQPLFHLGAKSPTCWDAPRSEP